MDPFNFNSSGLVNLIASQSSQTIDLGCSEVPKPASNAWLNTSKDPIVSNEQKAGTFWRRIEEYVNASPLLIGSVPREWSQCKQRWGMMNEQVCKFVGSHEAALKEQASGQNENDVMKAAHDIFFNDYHVKFSLEHCWRELRFDQKWRSHPFSKDGAKEKRKEPAEEVPAEEDVRPPGVKANKAAKRKKNMNDAAFDQVCRSRVAVGGCVRVDVLYAFFRLPGTLNDINVLDRSPVFDDILQGRAPKVKFKVNNHTYRMAYYLTDEIYPNWSTFIQSIPLPQGPKAELFAERQESTRKDVERAFGVLQSRFAIVKNSALLWDKEKIGRIMRSCVILHNMIVENERDGYTQIDTSEFESGESSKSSKVKRRTSFNIGGKPRLIPTRSSIRTRTVIGGKVAKATRTQDGHSSWSSITTRPRALGYARL
uniref:No apical meristem-associated C-terminal domain-containing protein n=1 Tax=Brassica oleracea var. oleracea TaxID=109376 RepID=A0A0D3BQH3_BRAOL